MSTIGYVRSVAANLPGSYEVLVGGHVKFRVGRLVYLSFSKDESEMGFAFPKDQRAWLIGGSPEKFMHPSRSDMRYHWVLARLDALDDRETHELVLDAWRMVVPKRVALAHRPQSPSGVGRRSDAAQTANGRQEERRMKIKLMTVFVDDQEKALRFYTKVLGFLKKADFSQGPYRWLTVVSAEAPDGAELQLERNDNQAAKAFQQAMFQQGRPGAMFFTDDVQRDYERIKAAGADFTMPPTKVTGSTIAQVNDTCGNLVQITQLDRYSG